MSISDRIAVMEKGVVQQFEVPKSFNLCAAVIGVDESGKSFRV